MIIALLVNFMLLRAFIYMPKKLKELMVVIRLLLLDPVVFGLTVRDSVPFSTKYQFLVLFAQE